MKILIAFNKYEYRGGEDAHVNGLSELLKRSGHTVILYFKDSRSIRTFKDKLLSLVGLFWSFSTAKEVNDLIDKHKPDVIHIHNIYPLISPTIYYVCKKRKIRIVQTIHNYKFLCPKNSLFRDNAICERCVDKTFFYPSVIFGCYHGSRIASLAYSLSFLLHRIIGVFGYIDTYVFPSLFTQDYYIKHACIPRKKTVYLPHFVEKNIHTAPKITQVTFPYFLYIGRISEEKGIAALLNIFSNLPHLKLLVVGEGNMREMLIKKYSPFDNIIFKPFSNRSQIATYYKNALAVIVPSVWYEVLPLVILEAISYNKALYVYRTKNSYKMFSGIKGISLFKEGELVSLLENFKQERQITDYRMIKKMIAPELYLENLLRIYQAVNHEKKQIG